MPQTDIVHVVRPGECLVSLAVEYGATSAAAIWNHPNNAAIREAHRHQTMLVPGDVVTIPSQAPTLLSLPQGGTHTFSGTVPTTTLRLHIRRDGVALENEAYVLSIGNKTVEKHTGTDGLVEIAVPVTCNEVTLLLPRFGEAYPIMLGYLEPEDTIAGISARLRNLGFYGGEGRNDPVAIEHVIPVYRVHAGLAAEGGIDADFIRALRDEHGC